MAEALHCVVGVDGGGTKTDCVVARTVDGAPLARVAAGGANFQQLGVDETRRLLTEVVSQALHAATAHAGEGLEVTGLCLAFAGAARPEDLQALHAIASALEASLMVPAVGWRLPDRGAVVVPDAVVALVGGTGVKVGVAVIAGTGSIAFGMNAAGEQRRAGGWGHVLGDEGSGYAMGRAALLAACRAADGRGPQTVLTDLILGHLNLAGSQHLVPLVYARWGERRVAEIAALTPLVGRAADNGDVVAIAIVNEAADELALSALAVIRGLALDQASFGVVTAGGAWHVSPRMASRFGEAVCAVAPLAQVGPPREEPVFGALLLARESAGAISLE